MAVARVWSQSAAVDPPPVCQPVRTLIVDDDAAVREVFSIILRDEGYLVDTASTGAAALDLLSRETFDILLVDVAMPDLGGIELMREAQRRAPNVPVVLVTGFGTVDLARRAMAEGAADFVTKPCSALSLPIILERNLTRHAHARLRTQRHEMELRASYESVLDALLSALDTRDTETEGHSERVTAYTMLIAERMELPAEERYHLERGALLHDVGKIGIPDRILLKPGALTDEEWVEMRCHPAIGYRMCARIPILRKASMIVLHHHERWDGKGYPDGLAGEEIPLGARIFAVADSFDAMTSDRPYRKAVSFAEARREIVACAGTQFDPRVVLNFRAIPEPRLREVRETWA